MDSLAIIIGAGLVAYLARYNATHKPRAIPAEIKPIARKRKMKRSTIKPSGKRILGRIDEVKIGSAVMPQGYSYPVPFNQPWVNFTVLFAWSKRRI